MDTPPGMYPAPGLIAFTGSGGTLQMRLGDRVIVVRSAGPDLDALRSWVAAPAGSGDAVALPPALAAHLLRHKVAVHNGDQGSVATEPRSAAVAAQAQTLARRYAAVDPQRRLSTGTVVLCGAGRLADRTAGLLAESGVGSVLRLDDARAGWPDGHIDLVLCCADSYRHSEFGAINRSALERGSAVLAVWVEGTAGFVGPLVDPFTSACLECTELRRCAATTRYGELVDYWDFLDGRPADYPVPAALTVPEEVVTAAIAVTTAVTVLSRPGPDGLSGVLWEVRSEPFGLVPHPVLPVPTCPACGDDTPARHRWRERSGG